MRLAALSTGALVLTAACAITSLLATAAAAQTANGILTYKGPDRDQKLIAGAKQEGAVVFYSGMIVNQALRPVTEAFEKNIRSSR